MNTDPSRSHSLVDQVGRPFLARRISQFHDMLADQGQVLLQARGIDLDARLASALHLIGTRARLSIAELADELDLSHQLATYRVRKLREAGLAVQERDPEDRTRYVLTLTPPGEAIHAGLRETMAVLDEVYAGLFAELGVDLFEAISRARDALRDTSIAQRAGAVTT